MIISVLAGEHVVLVVAGSTCSFAAKEKEKDKERKKKRERREK